MALKNVRADMAWYREWKAVRKALLVEPPEQRGFALVLPT